MKLATWNVNGIRARLAQVQEWIARERPDVVCLQEIKATARANPDRPFRAGRLLVVLARRQRLFRRCAARQQGVRARASGVRASRLRLRDPHRHGREIGDLTVASVYVPNGGKDFPAKMQFLEAHRRLRRVVCRPRAGTWP